jgi:hypothetical protein
MASVVENDLSPALLERAMRSESTAILDALEIAVDSGICLSDNEGATYRFAHALVREAICASLTVSARTRNNICIATALCDIAGPQPGLLSADIARHFAAAFPDPLSCRAIDFLVLAARWDVDRAAFDSAAAHLERALVFLERLCPGDARRRCELRLEQGWVCGLAGKRDDSRKALEECARLAEESGWGDVMARAALLYAPDLLAIETGVYDTDLVVLLENALRALPLDDAQRPRLLVRLAVALHWSEVPRERIEALVREATGEGENTSDAELKSFVKTAGRLALYSVESPHESIRESNPAGAEDSSTYLMRTILRVTALWQLGRMREVEIEVNEFGALLNRVRRPSAAWYVDMLQATMALMRGQYETAGELAERFLRTGMAVDDRNALHSFALQRAMLGIDVGNLEELEPAVVGMVSSFPRVEGWQAGLCYLYCELGQLVEARDVLEASVARGALSSFPRNSWFGTLCSLTLACRVIESPLIVEQLYDHWKRFPDQIAVVGFSSYCWGSTERFRGILAGLTCRWDIAEAHFDRAITANRAVGARPALAHTYADRAVMLDRKRLGDGRQSWDLALDHARSIGMANLERRILREAH